jgi:hypothetical protein
VRQRVGKRSATLLGPFRGIFAQPLRHFERLLLRLPFAIAALFPFREILLPDGFAAELRGHDGLHLGQRVEPPDERLARFALVPSWEQCLTKSLFSWVLLFFAPSLWATARQDTTPMDPSKH